MEPVGSRRMPDVDARSRSTWLEPCAAAMAYLTIFVILGRQWIASIGVALPVGPSLVSAGDAQVLAWSLAWVCHALISAPLKLFDANIFYPAPSQLTGGEHFLSSQLVFCPVFVLSNNALISAAVLAFLSYPIAALLMRSLLLAGGAHRATAFFMGLLFALGPLRVPANLHVIQYLNLYFPAVALALLRLRDIPDFRGVGALSCVVALSLLSAYYLAVMIAVVLVLWCASELWRASRTSKKVVVLVVLAVGLAVLPMIAMSLPYFGRGDVTTATASDYTWRSRELYLTYRDTPGVRELVSYIAAHGARNPTSGDPATVMALATRGAMFMLPQWFGMLSLGLAAVGLCVGVLRVPLLRRFVIPGGTLIIVGSLLMLLPLVTLAGPGFGTWLGGVVPAPLKLFRFPWRFIVLIGFGMSLCGAAAVEAVRRWLGVAGSAFVWLMVAASVAYYDGRFVAAMQPIPAQSQPIYQVLASIPRSGEPEPVLELPSADVRGNGLVWESMLGSTHHWLPLVNGMVSYPPRHAPEVKAAIDRLPDRDALDALVNLTHLRWLILRPQNEWSDPSARARILNASGVVTRASVDGWTLAWVDSRPSESARFDAIERGAD